MLVRETHSVISKIVLYECEGYSMKGGERKYFYDVVFTRSLDAESATRYMRHKHDDYTIMVTDIHRVESKMSVPIRDFIRAAKEI